MGTADDLLVTPPLPSKTDTSDLFRAIHVLDPGDDEDPSRCYEQVDPKDPDALPHGYDYHWWSQPYSGDGRAGLLTLADLADAFTRHSEKVSIANT